MAFEPPWRCPPRLESTQDLICVRAAQPRSLRGWRARKQIVKRMVLSTIHVSQAHILEKQSRRRTADSTVRPYGWIQEWTTAKYRSIVRSSALAEFGIQHARAIDTQSRLASASIDWLDEKGVLACCLFNQFMSNNPSAPERWLEPGEIIPVRQME